MNAEEAVRLARLAAAEDPVRMARAFKATVEAAREAREAGLPGQLDHASATSPLATFLAASR